MRGHRRFADEMAGRSRDKMPGKPRRKAIARGYVEFAQKNPELCADGEAFERGAKCRAVQPLGPVPAPDWFGLPPGWQLPRTPHTAHRQVSL
jgi:hypothetical protein